ncbi:hypothetical protein [Kitasatospora mediocidica]|uniref:hypothetical protein n=1 Tax=Kitasatospora mediocidica TaxID=58352 RepID=UPI0005682DF2|nr:hypothetical protein [Kitasatospora mediocidica]
MSYRPRFRSAVIGACTTALIAGSGLLALPARAQTQAAATARSLRSTPSERTVADFFQQYEDATRGEQSKGLDTAQVREEFLTPELDKALSDWGAANMKDPVLRSNDLPQTYSVTPKSEADGHATLVLTENWADGTSTDVWYQVQTATQLIDGLTDTPAAA